MISQDCIDCLVIGAGPAGLATAIYLARFRRRFLVIDDGNSRAGWIPVTHNHAGFADGIRGTELLSRMTSHAKKYGATITQGSVTTLARDRDGFFVATGADGRVIQASTVVLATGVIDEEPELPNLRQAVRRGLIRHCGICDGYEVIDKKIGVIGYGRTGLGEALFLRNYSSDITLLSLGRPLNLPPEDQLRMEEAGIKSIEAAVTEVAVEGERVTALRVHAARHTLLIPFTPLSAARRARAYCMGWGQPSMKGNASSSITISEARSTVSLWPATSPAAWIRSPLRWGKRRSPPPQSTTG